MMFILLIASIGLSVGKHYCNGNLIGVYLLSLRNQTCDSNMPMDDDSCQNNIIGFWTVEQAEFIPSDVDIKMSFQWLDLVANTFLDKVSELRNDHQIILAFSHPKANIKIYLRKESFLN